jgi:lipid II:glycine glycyltransferase (peptidoglycan interpeptide bridge formation enzyme)
LRAGYALQWAVLDRLRNQVDWYDLGRSPEEGLRQFKSGFVGKAGTIMHMPGEFDFSPNAKGRFVLWLIFTVREARRRFREFLAAIRRI